MTEDKKLHWTQTEAGKKKMARVQQRAWKKRRAHSKAERAHSKAERLVEKRVGKSNGVERRQHVYQRAVDTAIAAREVKQLAELLAYAALRMLAEGRS